MHSILENVATHTVLNEVEKKFFVSMLKNRSLKRKEFLYRAGEHHDALTFVSKGCLRTYSTDPQGNEHIVMFSPENWWCADMASFLTGKPAAYSIDTLLPADVWGITNTNLEKLYKEIPVFERFFRMLFQNAFIIYQNRITGNLSLKAEQRYKQFIKTYPGLQSRIPQKYIASYLGVTPEFFSGMKK